MRKRAVPAFMAEKTQKSPPLREAVGGIIKLCVEKGGAAGVGAVRANVAYTSVSFLINYINELKLHDMPGAVFFTFECA